LRTVTITGPRTVDIIDVPEPQGRGDIVKVKILVTPTCTEWGSYRNGMSPDPLGHEAAGVVVDPGTSTFREGERVVVMPGYGCGHCYSCLEGEHIRCTAQRDALTETGSTSGRSTYAQYMLKPASLLLRVPDDISLTHASLACCALGPTLNAFETLRIDVFDTLVISGCGPVGLGGLIHAAVRGTSSICLEPDPQRSPLAMALGANAVVDPTDPQARDRLLEFTAGQGVSAAIETSGSPTAPHFLETVLQSRGRLAILAWGAPVDLRNVVPAGLELHGCWHWNHLRYGRRMFETIRRSAPLLDQFVTHSFPLDEVAEAWDVQLSKTCGKVLLFPWGLDADGLQPTRTREGAAPASARAGITRGAA
jgi:L-iditol 2-dehydrogenase